MSGMSVEDVSRFHQRFGEGGMRMNSLGQVVGSRSHL